MIHLEFPWLPPSVNNLYRDTFFKAKGKLMSKRSLTDEGKLFKKETLAYIVKKYQPGLRFFKKNVPYVFYYRFLVQELENKTWPKNAENRYKKFDASNLVKVLEDVIVEASGIDDSNYLTVVSEKRKGTKEATHIWVWNIEEEGCPFHAAALSL